MSTEAEGQPTGGFGHLPWQQVPRFTPRVTNVDEYSQRLKFPRPDIAAKVGRINQEATVNGVAAILETATPHGGRRL